MIGTIYIEDDIAEHPRTREIAARLPKARRVACRRYGEVFNRRAQSFRLQKRQPSLILARKFDRFVLPAPPSYGIGSERNFYFSHMLNCLYDCRYCFLQGMYRSAHYVVFVNYEGFFEQISALTAGADEETYFFSGYDCDSLAFDKVTGFVDHALPLFRRLPRAWLELRTKSVQIDTLLATEPLPNVVVAFSFTPQLIAEALEHKTPSVTRRIAAMVRLGERGWRLGLRFDPLIYCDDFKIRYGELFEQVFAAVEGMPLHSVSFGPFRLPADFFRTLERLYPDEPLVAGPLERRGAMVSYREELEAEMVETCEGLLLKHVPSDIFFPCSPDP